MTTPIIEFNQVNKLYENGQEALQKVSFRLNKGEIVFLTGHSGAGKSTLLRLIALIERATTGDVIIGGVKLDTLSKKQVPYLRRSIGIIFQNPHLLAERTVFDNVALPLVIANYGYHETKRRVRAALDKVGLLKKENCLPRALSGGEQQRVGIARAIVNKPSLVLADEPTGNLDPELSREIMSLFEQFNQVGVSLLIATHDLGLIAQMHHRILTLNSGKLIGDIGEQA